MLVGIKVVFGFRLSPGAVELLLVEDQRNLVQAEIHSEEPYLIGVLAIEEEVPGIT
jgi:hypothetical protein